jgi:glutamyl-tRNA reductase
MLENCFVFGFNHQNTSESDRSRVALTEELTSQLMSLMDKQEVSSLIVLNTCNRTECYGWGNSDHLKVMYFKLMQLDESLKERFMLISGMDALNYIFSVAAGLQSQIIGDLEILGQFKQACKLSKKNGLIDGYFERVVNTCIQAAKEVRSETKITNGTVSLSYAAIKLLNKLGYNNQSSGKVLMVGTGAFGKNIARDLSVFLPKLDLFVTNRTATKAEAVANTYHGKVVPFESYLNELNSFQIIISAITNDSGNYLINASHFIGDHTRIFIDLSVPKVIDPVVGQLPNSSFHSIDDAAQIINESLHQRKEHLPLAQKIIQKYLLEFINWSKLYEKRGSISLWRTTLLNSVTQCPVLNKLEESEKQRIVRKGLAEFSLFLKEHPTLPNDPTFVVNHFRKHHPTLLSNYYNQPKKSVVYEG